MCLLCAGVLSRRRLVPIRAQVLLRLGEDLRVATLSHCTCVNNCHFCVQRCSENLRHTLASYSNRCDCVDFDGVFSKTRYFTHGVATPPKEKKDLSEQQESGMLPCSAGGTCVMTPERSSVHKTIYTEKGLPSLSTSSCMNITEKQ